MGRSVTADKETPAKVTFAPVTSKENCFISATNIVEDIRERAQTLAELRESRALFHQTAETAPVGIVVSDKEQRTIYINKRFEQLFNYDMQDMLTVNEWWELAYPDAAVRQSAREARKREHASEPGLEPDRSPGLP